MKKLFNNLPFRLLLGIIIGVILGQVFPESVMKVVVTLQYIMGQLITFCVPLIIIGFIAPSITKLGKNASRLLGVAIVIAYVSSVCAALMSAGAGYALIPHLSIDTEVAGLRTLPDVVFELNIPQIMSVMSALVLSVLVGLAATWTNSKLTCDFLGEFQNIVLDIVGKIIIPMLPFYIAATFCNLSYEGMITHQLPAFIQIILIVMAGHYIWLAVLYLLAGAYSGKNPWEVLRHYGPAYLTAVGTMSSAATLAVALDCARKSKVLRKDMVSFGIPLFANIHLCGSVLTEVFFCMTISKILYGHLPSIGTMLLFCALLGIFAIGAPGVPGGTVMASLGLITGVLMFDDAGTALMLAIFALQDSFGTHRQAQPRRLRAGQPVQGEQGIGAAAALLEHHGIFGAQTNPRAARESRARAGGHRGDADRDGPRCGRDRLPDRQRRGGGPAAGQAQRRLRPLARRRARTLRPSAVFMRARKPWSRLRLRLLGWKVRLVAMVALGCIRIERTGNSRGSPGGRSSHPGGRLPRGRPAPLHGPVDNPWVIPGPMVGWCVRFPTLSRPHAVARRHPGPGPPPSEHCRTDGSLAPLP